MSTGPSSTNNTTFEERELGSTPKNNIERGSKINDI